MSQYIFWTEEMGGRVGVEEEEEENDGDSGRRKKKPRETWFKLPQFCISHQENGIRFHHSDLIWYSSCSNCIRYQDKWEITGKHLEREIEANFGMTLCRGVMSIAAERSVAAGIMMMMIWYLTIRRLDQKAGWEDWMWWSLTFILMLSWLLPYWAWQAALIMA